MLAAWPTATVVWEWCWLRATLGGCCGKQHNHTCLSIQSQKACQQGCQWLGYQKLLMSHVDMDKMLMWVMC